MQSKCWPLLIFVVGAAAGWGAEPWVSMDSSGHLQYRMTKRGDRILDFSYAGYMGYGNDSRQSGPFGDFADRPLSTRTLMRLSFQSLGYYERWSKLLLCKRGAQKKLVYNSFGLDHLR
jgi:hypothetical protein